MREVKRWARALTILFLVTGAARADSIQPVDAALCADMKAHHVLNANAPVGCDRLEVVTFAYVDFDGREHDDGMVMVMDAVAARVLQIFEVLHAQHFPIAKAQPVNAYEGDDEASMADNNTSAFNDRLVPGTARISLHAYGVAIDLNPVQNPFIVRSGAGFSVHPATAADYLNRNLHRPGKPERPGMAEEVVEIFARNGFTVWGGNWDDPIDYQHFDIGRPLAEELVKLTPSEARLHFEEVATCRVSHCGQGKADSAASP